MTKEETLIDEARRAFDIWNAENERIVRAFQEAQAATTERYREALDAAQHKYRDREDLRTKA